MVGHLEHYLVVKWGCLLVVKTARWRAASMALMKVDWLAKRSAARLARYSVDLWAFPTERKMVPH